MASIKCMCGAVELAFGIDHDLFRLQCCCHDCSAALWYASKRGGPKHPPHQCVDTSWLPNDFRIVRGEAHIGAYMNFHGADTTRFYCRECWTVLIGDHEVYAEKVLVTATNNITECDSLTGIELMPFQARHFMRDLSPEQRANLPEWTGDSARIYESVADVLMEQFPSIQAAGSKGVEMNAQRLLENVGAPFIPEQEPVLSDGPPTLMQQLV